MGCSCASEAAVEVEVVEREKRVKKESIACRVVKVAGVATNGSKAQSRKRSLLGSSTPALEPIYVSTCLG